MILNINENTMKSLKLISNHKTKMEPKATNILPCVAKKGNGQEIPRGSQR